ncbi:helicase associated domain-containing protein [Streptomyces sp. NPDC001777]|uniref:helicase associated domain-containing protein n=1 Tax=Streptomyces sp. NPDC001777 TaxID=3364608 RepID=UPI0036CB21E3
MVWDENEAAWQGHMATVEAFHAEHGHLAIPSQEPGGQFLADQRSLARKDRLVPSREAQLTALDPHWTLPHGPDWHRKYHLIKHHIEAGHDPATLRRDTVIDGVKAGSWLHRQFTTWHELNSGQHDLLTSLGLTTDQVPLRQTPRTPVTSGTRKRRSFEQTALLLRAFVERHGRPPGTREGIEADGEHVMIGPWLCKTRTKQKADQLPEE